jgi:hypothetical protein
MMVVMERTQAFMLPYLESQSLSDTLNRQLPQLFNFLLLHKEFF